MRTPAVVLGLNPNALGLIKSLERHDVPVVAIDREPGGWGSTHTWMSSRTRLAEKILIPGDADHDDWVDAIRSVAERHGDRPVILPSGDHHVYLLSDRRAELEAIARFHVPDREVLDLLMMKGRFHRFCLEHGIATPRTWLDIQPGTTAADLEGIRYPCIVKPELRDGRWDRVFAPAKLMTARDAAELEDCIRRASETGLELMVQEVVPGGDDQLYFSHAYYDVDHRRAAVWTGRKLRQHPLSFGTSTLVETLDVPRVAEVTDGIVQALGLIGYVSVEFKWDPRDSEYKLLEVTPARSWYPHYLGTVAGVNLTWLWYQDLLGRPLPRVAPPQPPDGIAWVDEYRDVIASFEAWQLGELTMSAWGRSYLGVRGFALASLRDPLPGLFILLRFGLSAVNGLKRLVGR